MAAQQRCYLYFLWLLTDPIYILGAHHAPPESANPELPP